MSVPSSEKPPANTKPYRIVGHALLWLGFLWLMASRILFDAGVLAKKSRFTSDEIPPQESYTLSDMRNVVKKFGDQIRNDPPWLFTPATLMLAGGLLLARARSS